jgi:hypothetical protein
VENGGTGKIYNNTKYGHGVDERYKEVKIAII